MKFVLQTQLFPRVGFKMYVDKGGSRKSFFFSQTSCVLQSNLTKIEIPQTWTWKIIENLARSLMMLTLCLYVLIEF